MDKNAELAEMVVNNEITLEDAIQSTKDISDLMSKVNLRKSMRYALQTAVMYRKLMELRISIPALTFAYGRYASLVNEYSSLSWDWIRGKTNADYYERLFDVEGSITDYLRNTDLRFMEDDVIAALSPSRALGLDFDPDSPYCKTDVSYKEYCEELLNPTREALSKRITEANRLDVGVPRMMIATLFQGVSEMLDTMSAALLG